MHGKLLGKIFEYSFEHYLRCNEHMQSRESDRFPWDGAYRLEIISTQGVIPEVLV